MPRKYVRTSNRAQYTVTVLLDALKSIAEGASIKATAKLSGISARTLRRHRDGKVMKPGAVKLGRFSPDIGQDYEEELVLHIRKMEKALFGLTAVDVRKLAFDFATKIGVAHRFNMEGKMAGLDWLQGFLSRHPTLSIRRPEATNIARAVGFNRPQVDNFFSVYKDILTDHVYSPTRVWNADETGISTVHKPVKIIATKGAREVGKITSGERGKNVTVMCAMNAAGNFIPPMFIFPRKRMVDSLMNSAPAGAIGVCTDSGWIDGDTFLKWLKHFASVAKPTQDDKHIIILDGHHSHKTLAAVDYARENGIELITLPPHCTHKMQPLDTCIFKALKAAFNVTSDTWMVANQGRRISFFELAEIFSVAYNKAASVEKAVKGFKACGLWPYNDQVFTDEDFSAADFTDEPVPEPASAATQQAAQPQEHAPQIATAGDAKREPVPSTSGNPARARENNVPREIVDEAQSPKEILAELCTPVKAVAKRKRTRRAEHASHLTSSPYKRMLIEKQSCKPKGKGKGNGKGKGKGKGKNVLAKVSRDVTVIRKRSQKQLCQDSSSDDESWPCLVCGEPFLNSRSGEKWVQCVVCRLWSHEDCTNGDRQYVCQNCESGDED